MPLHRNLSNSLKAIRSQKKLSVTEFSEEIGISRSSLQEILNGTGNPRMDTIQHIADKLGIDPIHLLCPQYSESQLNLASLLLETLEFISQLPPKDIEEAADLFQKLVLLMEDNHED